MTAQPYLMTAQPLILVPNDVLLLRRAFVNAKLLNPIHFVSSAEDVMGYLTSAGKPIQ